MAKRLFKRNFLETMNFITYLFRHRNTRIFIRNNWDWASNDDLNIIRLGKSTLRDRNEYKFDLIGLSLVILVSKNE